MSDMRKLIDMINEATVDADSAPPTYEDGDKDFYDTMEKTGFFGDQAAGAILLAKKTGRILLVLRSAKVLQPHTWGNVGGAHHADENPVDAAKREAHEETGYNGSMSLIPLLVFRKGNDFVYRNFLAVVEDEFVPNLGWEATDHRWCDFGDWPQPLHFGMEGLFDDAASVATIKKYITLDENFTSSSVDVHAAITAGRNLANELNKPEPAPEPEPEQNSDNIKNDAQPTEKK